MEDILISSPNGVRRFDTVNQMGVDVLGVDVMALILLEYGSSVWDPQNILLQDELGKVQKSAARFITGNYTYSPGSMIGTPEQLR